MPFLGVTTNVNSDAFSKNFIDYEEYPVSADIQNRTYQRCQIRNSWLRSNRMCLYDC